MAKLCCTGPDGLRGRDPALPCIVKAAADNTQADADGCLTAEFCLQKRAVDFTETENR